MKTNYDYEKTLGKIQDIMNQIDEVASITDTAKLDLARCTTSTTDITVTTALMNTVNDLAAAAKALNLARYIMMSARKNVESTEARVK